MKKKILVISLMAMLLICLFAISVAAENNIIKLSKLPTLDEIHANPEQYVSHLDKFNGNSYGDIDSKSVVVLSDLATTPTYYVFPSYYYIQSDTNQVNGQLATLNKYIKEADETAFAGYSAVDGNWCQGACKYLIRFEVPTYVTTLASKAKFQNSSNLIELYFPTKVIDGKIKSYITNVSGENIFGNCDSLKYIHNLEYLPAEAVSGKANFEKCYSLEEIKVPNTATAIAVNCFNQCSALTTVVLPSSVTSIGQGAFDVCGSLKTVYFMGTEDEFNAITVENYNNPYNKLTKTSFEDYKSLSEETLANGLYRVYGVADCYINNSDNHPSITITNCVGICSACGDTIIRHSESENIATTIVYTSYTASGTKTVSCTNDGCTYKETTTVPAIFICLGYSAPEDGRGGIAIGFTVNNVAIAEYEEATGKTLKYGVFAVLQSKIKDKDVFAEDGTAAEGVISAEITNYQFSAFELKIVGFDDDQKDTKLAMGAYVTVTDGEATEYSYMQDDTKGITNGKYYFVSYNDIVK